MAGMEKGLQNEADEALRILNERGLTNEDEKSKLLRDALKVARDSSYDATERREIKPKLEGELDGQEQNLKYLHDAAMYISVGIIRAARKI